MNIKKMTAVIMAALVIASFSGCGTPKNSSSDSGTPVTLLDTSDMFSSRDIESGYEESECTIIKLNGTSASIDGEGATAKKGTVKVDSEGTYLISGTLDDGIIVVDADSSDKIRLILNGVTIRSSTGAAIYVKQADKVFITLAKGTENTLSNTTDSEMADNVDAVVFSKDDLTVNGEGSLTVTANSGHAIVCKDDLVISGGKYSITSQKKALDANDSIRIAGGTFDIDAVQNEVALPVILSDIGQMMGILLSGNHGVIPENPDAVFRGLHDGRSGILFGYRKVPGIDGGVLLMNHSGIGTRRAGQAHCQHKKQGSGDPFEIMRHDFPS